MAIAPTGDIFKGFEFDGESSKDYGVYITGEAVYNAPTRDVEMISIPGRNGAFALDGGRFENIEVTYPAGIFADDETNFAEAISDFRNYLCSRNGYVRLSDEYHPNEYRMAIYKSGLEVSPAQLKAGEFNIVFDCKPQRWLTAGETKITVADGETLTNPTLFGSNPLLEVAGYGNISFNDYSIELDNNTVGEILVADATTGQTTITIDTSKLQTGDEIYARSSEQYLIAANVTVSAADNYYLDRAKTKTVTDFAFALNSSSASNGFVYGTSKTKYYSTAGTGIFMIYDSNGEYISVISSFTLFLSLVYDGADTITVGYSVTEGLNPEYITVDSVSLLTKPIYANSTMLLGEVYIDCEIGEAYFLDNGSVVPLNQNVDLGSDLPKLAPGSNIISVDSSITELKIVPRWWKI